jgi:hypothetical protein
VAWYLFTSIRRQLEAVSLGQAVIYTTGLRTSALAETTSLQCDKLRDRIVSAARDPPSTPNGMRPR